MQLMVEQATLAKTKSIGTSTRGRMLFARCALSAFRYLPLLRTARRRRSRPELAHQDDEQRAEAYAATRGGAAQRLPGGEESVAGTNLEECPSPGADVAGASPVTQGHLNSGGARPATSAPGLLPAGRDLRISVPAKPLRRLLSVLAERASRLATEHSDLQVSAAEWLVPSRTNSGYCRLSSTCHTAQALRKLHPHTMPAARLQYHRVI